MDFFDDCRPFTSGSREPPDEQDGFLETTGYYRKHTARDPTSLFGVVSEHVFDIQLYHDKVREDCANYLEKNRKDYEKEMDKNFDHYLSNLRKLATPGTLLELRALAHCYKRNVMIFEPFTAGKWYIEEDEYRVSKPILIFYTADKHFDSIYRKNIELAAKCQDVFQLPDVSKPLKDDPDKYEIVSGKIVEFDSHQTTSCVLENSLMCHFHNRSNFRKFVDSTGRSRKPLDDIIYDEKIAPFSYKVDKALDRSIHSNIEFDLWNDENSMKYCGENSGYEMVKKEWDDDLKKRAVFMDDQCSFKMDSLIRYQHFQPCETDAIVMQASLNPRGYENNMDESNGSQNQGSPSGDDFLYNQQYYEKVQYMPYDQQANQEAPIQPHPYYAQQYPVPMVVHPPATQMHLPHLGLTFTDFFNLAQGSDFFKNIDFICRDCADPDDMSLQFFYNLGVKYFQYCAMFHQGTSVGPAISQEVERAESQTSSNPLQEQRKPDLATPLTGKPGNSGPKNHPETPRKLSPGSEKRDDETALTANSAASMLSPVQTLGEFVRNFVANLKKDPILVLPFFEESTRIRSNKLPGSATTMGFFKNFPLDLRGYFFEVMTVKIQENLEALVEIEGKSLKWILKLMMARFENKFLIKHCTINFENLTIEKYAKNIVKEKNIEEIRRNVRQSLCLNEK